MKPVLWPIYKGLWPNYYGHNLYISWPKVTLWLTIIFSLPMAITGL